MRTTRLVVATRSIGVPGLSRRSSKGLRRKSTWPSLLCTATARKIFPSRRNKLPYWASQMRVAFVNKALKTGSSSPGELEMTFSTSEVAVCWSNDSLKSSVRWRSSLSSRVFSMAIAAWLEKVFSSSSRIFGIGPGSAQPTTIAPSSSLPCSIGTPKSRRKPRDRGNCWSWFGSASESSIRTTDFVSVTLPTTWEESGRIGNFLCSISRKFGPTLWLATKCNNSPSKRNTFAYRLPQRETAFRTIVSNTGCASAGEVRIT